MNTLRFAAYTVLLLAAALFLPCNVTGCASDSSEFPDAGAVPQLAQDGAAQPSPDLAEAPVPRLQPAEDQAWWWEQSTMLGCGAEDYVRAVWCPLAGYRNAYPRAYRPMRDGKLGVRCLFFRAGADGRWRCLPALPQIDSPQYTRDGFFAQETTSAHSCWSYRDWRFVLPADSAPYLVLFDYEAESYRVFRAIPDERPVLRGQLALPAPFPTCTPARQDVRYFTKGQEVPTNEFVALDEHAQVKVDGNDVRQRFVE